VKPSSFRSYMTVVALTASSTSLCACAPDEATSGDNLGGNGGAGGGAAAGSAAAGSAALGGGSTGGGSTGGSGASAATAPMTGGSPSAGAGGMPSAGAAGSAGQTQGGASALPDPGTDGDGNFKIGPSYTSQPELSDQGNPKGKSFSFSMSLAESKLFDGKDPTLNPSKNVNANRSINVYIPAKYEDGTPAPVLVIQDGPGEINQVKNALDNLTIDPDPMRRLPPFIAVAVQNGGNDSIGSERGLEYDTLSDRYARFIDTEVLPAVVNNAQIKAAYPKLKFTTDPSGRAASGCSSGAAAAFTMGWFRPDLFGRIITYSGTLVAQQNPEAPENDAFPHGAWDYHSELELIKNDTMMREKSLRIFLNVNENDLGSTAAESGQHNWVMANDRTAEDLKTKGFHYRYVFGQGKGHCDGSVRSATLADALMWVWRGYVPSGR
jgi:iron(III)-enterobactin esterase